MSAARAKQPMPPRPPFRERLLPLLYRRLSLMYYRRSGRYARHRARVGPETALPVPPLVDVLAVYLSQRLPAGLVCRVGIAGLFRAAKVLTVLLRTGASLTLPALWLARQIWRAMKWLRGPRPSGVCFVRPAPVGDAQVVLGGKVRFRGFTYADDRLCCFFERLRRVPNPCQIFVHIYPETPDVLPAEYAADGRFSKDHSPVYPLPSWPRGRVYRDEVSLADLPPGDYRVEVGLLDVVLRERLWCDENGRSALDLGWVRVGGTPCEAPQRAAAGAAHAGA